jgi:hypothetical protein
MTMIAEMKPCRIRALLMANPDCGHPINSPSEVDADRPTAGGLPCTLSAGYPSKIPRCGAGGRDGTTPF